MNAQLLDPRSGLPLAGRSWKTAPGAGFGAGTGTGKRKTHKGFISMCISSFRRDKSRSVVLRRQCCARPTWRARS